VDVAILEINAKTDLKIKLVSIERSKHRRVVALNFTIKTQPVPKRATRLKQAGAGKAARQSFSSLVYLMRQPGAIRPTTVCKIADVTKLFGNRNFPFPE
jgi:hypothetical protein